ncbi:MAG: isocitrate dehydrogenase (NADP(+)) [Nitrospiraceae bacterium]|nr:isocitrate dehydrogenase (NADP(+)) [Nitrospiraceae bacterium]
MDLKYEKPREGEKIEMKDGRLVIPDNPIVPYIEGDGIGPDIWKATKRVVNEAVKRSYDGRKRIEWMKLYAGEEANEKTGKYLPEETIKAIEDYLVAIKGPLTTPVGGGMRSLNVTLRQRLDLYACVRPVRWFKGVPAPVKHPEKLDVVVFRENVEDVYVGIEWPMGDPAVKDIYGVLKKYGEMNKIRFPESTAIGIKPISMEGSQRLISSAIRYAKAHKRKSVTIVHKGNIMKYTEGGFKKWGYDVALQKFRDWIITEDELWDRMKKADGVTPVTKKGAFSHLRGGKPPGDPGGRIVVKDRIADAMFQQLLLRPDEYDVIATPNLTGDYLSDACAAQVGGLGLAPGANINYQTGHAIFEATHGSAPKYRNMNKVNPGSLILSAVMMLEYFEWYKARKLIIDSMEKTIEEKNVTYDLARQIEGANLMKTSEFADRIIENMGA